MSNVAAMPATIVAHPALDQVLDRAARSVRTVPRSTTSCGITFQVSPPCTCVTLTTPASSGCRLRATIVCSALMSVRREQHRIAAEVRHRRVRALAGRDDLEDVERAHQRAGAQRRSCRPAVPRPVVHPVHGLHREPVEEALLDHDAAAALVFLGRLEDEIRRAVEIACVAPSPARRRAASPCDRRGRTRASCPSMCDACGTPDFSWMCSASRSARRPIAPSAAIRCAARRRRRSSRVPYARRARRSGSLSATNALVAVSSNAVSGCAWM